MPETTTPAGTSITTPETHDPQSTPTADAFFSSLVEQANNGDEAALDRLRSTLDDNPQIWQRVGDLAAHARLTLIRLIAGGNKLLFESIERKARELEAELLSSSPTPLERLSVQRVVACWIQFHHADTAIITRTDTLAQQKLLAQQQDRAHRRYEAAIRQLLLVQQAMPKYSKEQRDATTPTKEDATVKNFDPEGAPQVEAVDRPLFAASGGNGHVNGSGGRNGKVLLPEEPVPANGRLHNRILRFSEATALPSGTD